MDGLEIQSQHERGIVAPFRKKRKREFKNRSRLAGAVIAPEPPAGIIKVSGRAPVQELNCRLVLVAHVLIPSFAADSPKSFQHGVKCSCSIKPVGEVAQLGR